MVLRAGAVRPFLTGLSLTALTASLAAACSNEPAPKMVAATNDGVPANSASEERLNKGGKPKPEAPPPEDPSQPYTTPVGGDGTTTPMPSSSASAGKPGKGGKGARLADSTKVSKAECRALFDKYIDLTIGTDSRFDGIPPEMVAQLKASAVAQAQSEKGDPCSTQDVTRAQYDCALGSSTTAGWQRCLK